MFVPPRPKQMDENGQLVVADDLLSGSGHDANTLDDADITCAAEVPVDEGQTHRNRNNADLITFD